MTELKELQEEMSKLQKQIATVLNISKYREYDDLSGVNYSVRNPDDLLLIDEYKNMLYKLSDVQYDLEYLSKSILFEDTLVLRPDGRYGTNNGKTYYTSGSGIEFLCTDECLNEEGHFEDMQAWRTSTVEHNGTDYYIVGYKDLDMNGLKVRVRSR